MATYKEYLDNLKKQVDSLEVLKGKIDQNEFYKRIRVFRNEEVEKQFAISSLVRLLLKNGITVDKELLDIYEMFKDNVSHLKKGVEEVGFFEPYEIRYYFLIYRKRWITLSENKKLLSALEKILGPTIISLKEELDSLNDIINKTLVNKKISSLSEEEARKICYNILLEELNDEISKIEEKVNKIKYNFENNEELKEFNINIDPEYVENLQKIESLRKQKEELKKEVSKMSMDEVFFKLNGKLGGTSYYEKQKESLDAKRKLESENISNLKEEKVKTENLLNVMSEILKKTEEKEVYEKGRKQRNDIYNKIQNSDDFIKLRVSIHEYNLVKESVIKISNELAELNIKLKEIKDKEIKYDGLSFFEKKGKKGKELKSQIENKQKVENDIEVKSQEKDKKVEKLRKLEQDIKKFENSFKKLLEDNNVTINLYKIGDFLLLKNTFDIEEELKKYNNVYEYEINNYNMQLQNLYSKLNSYGYNVGTLSNLKELLDSKTKLLDEIKIAMEFRYDDNELLDKAFELMGDSTLSDEEFKEKIEGRIR